MGINASPPSSAVFVVSRLGHQMINTALTQNYRKIKKEQISNGNGHIKRFVFDNSSVLAQIIHSILLNDNDVRLVLIYHYPNPQTKKEQ